MKKCTGVFLIIILLGIRCFADNSTDSRKLLDEYISIYGKNIQQGIDDTDSEVFDKSFPSFSVDKLLSDVASGKNIFSIQSILSKLWSLFFGEIRRTLKLLILILSIAVLNTYLYGMQGSFRSAGAVHTAFFVCYALMVGIASAAFLETVKCCLQVIENVAVFMRILIPVSLASLAASGAAVSATTFEMLLMSIIEFTQIAIEKLFVPLVMATTALNIANNISTSFNAERLAKLISKTVRWGLGIMLTLFVGITGLQGIASGSADGLTVKVTKFAASNLIPMVGGILSETVETVMNCSVVIKNAVGIVGIIAVILMAVVPVVKVAVCLVLFRLCAALIQPIAEERWVKCLSDFGDSVSSILAMAVAVVIMFVIILTIIINVGNAALMLGR